MPMERTFPVLALWICAVGAALWPAAARGESIFQQPSSREGHWEFSVQTRYVGAFSGGGVEGSSVTVDDDLGWGFGFGYNYSERFQFGGFLNWRGMGYEAVVADGDDPSLLSGYTGWLETSNFGLSGMWNVLPKRVTPYANGSVGWALVDTNIPAGISTGCWWDPWWGYICAPYGTTYGNDGISYSLGAGISLQPGQSVLFRAGYERGWIDIGKTHGFDMFRVDLGIHYR